MGNGNGRSDVLDALVDDVSALKARADRFEENMASMRKTLSDVVAITQAIADRLVSMSEKLDDHDRRFDRIEAEHGRRFDRIEALLLSRKT